MTVNFFTRYVYLELKGPRDPACHGELHSSARVDSRTQRARHPAWRLPPQQRLPMCRGDLTKRVRMMTVLVVVVVVVVVVAVHLPGSLMLMLVVVLQLVLQDLYKNLE